MHYPQNELIWFVIMLSSVLTCHGLIDGHSYGDITSLRLTPISGENYRCPVSTPANYLSSSDDISRSKTLPNISLQKRVQVGTTANELPQRPLTSQRSVQCKSRTGSSKFGNSFEICFMDIPPDPYINESQQRHWLKSLCSQPVDEILNKYRRNNDFNRTQNIWSQKSSTPGEKSLLSAWQSNTTQRRGIVTFMGGAKPCLRSESKLGVVLNRYNPQINYEDQGIGINEKAYIYDREVLSPYLKRSPRLGEYLKDDSCLSHKNLYMTPSSTRRVMTDIHDQLLVTKMGIHQVVHASQRYNE